MGSRNKSEISQVFLKTKYIGIACVQKKDFIQRPDTKKVDQTFFKKKMLIKYNLLKKILTLHTM